MSIMDRGYCATRNHIEVDRNNELPSRGVRLSVYSVLRASRFGVIVWIISALALGFLVGWQAGVLVLAILISLCIVIFLYRKVKGHTFRCSGLGALASSLRVVDLISW